MSTDDVSPAEQYTGEVEGQLPSYIQDRLVKHGNEAPWHIQYQEQLADDETTDIDSYDEIETWEDLRTAFGYLDDDDLLQMNPRDLVPQSYDEDELVLSRSSGTTGEPKEFYWHEDDIEANAEYVTQVFDEQGIMPEDTHWATTATPNPVLQHELEYAADKYDSSIDMIEVNPGPIKQALLSGDKKRMAEALDPIADQLIDVFEENDVKVYEDIAPLMQYVGQKLPEEHRENVEVLLIGGVGTDQETVDMLTEQAFPNADLSGWYGDYMTGASMMTEPNTLEYSPREPDAQIEVRDRDDLDTVVPVGEDGEVVAHAIYKGGFIPNRRIGDKATRNTTETGDTITDIGRLED